MGHYFVVGLNHKTAPVNIREQFHFHELEVQDALKKIVDRTSIDEVMILSTCNRVEVIGVCSRLDKIPAILTHFLAKLKKVEIDKLEDYLYFFSDTEAISHVMRVTASLDSMVIGEPQIMGQMKAALNCAELAGTMGKELHHLLTEAFRVAKKIRTQTNIAANAVSVSFVAVELAKEILGDLSQTRIMVVGAGKMSSLTLKHLRKISTSGELVITSRTAENAQLIAEEFDGHIIPFNKITDYLAEIDIIISSTGSCEYILTHQDFLKCDRCGKPLFIIDIAVPRDIDPDIKTIPQIHLFDIDDLRDKAQNNLQNRLKEASKAEKVIIQEVDKFEKYLNIELIKPLIISLQDKLKGIRLEEMNRHSKELSRMNESDRQFVEYFSQSLINRILHNPLCSLKNEELFEKPLPAQDVITKLFDLDNRTSQTCSDEAKRND